MYLTITSVLTACVSVSLLVLVFCGIFRRDDVLRKAGPECGIFILLCIVARMFLPVELWFTYSVRVERIFPDVYSVLIYEITGGEYPVCVWDILMCVWAAGIVCQLGKKFFFCRKLRRMIRLLPAKAVGEFMRERGLDGPEADGNVKVVVTEIVKTPCLVGIKKGYILLPEDIYTEEELSYIIRHEVMHYQKRHVWYKTLTDILCTVFWWNPVFIYLKKTVFHMIEISNDRVLTKDMQEKEKVEYMECLKNTAAKMRRQEVPFGVSFSKNSVRELKQRLCLIGERIGGDNGFRGKLVFLAAVLLCASFFVIFEPCTPAPEGIPMTAENTYLIRNGEEYDVYVEGKYLFTTDFLEPFRGVPKYNEK